MGLGCLNSMLGENPTFPGLPGVASTLSSRECLCCNPAGPSFSGRHLAKIMGWQFCYDLSAVCLTFFTTAAQKWPKRPSGLLGFPPPSVMMATSIFCSTIQTEMVSGTGLPRATAQHPLSPQERFQEDSRRRAAREGRGTVEWPVVSSELKAVLQEARTGSVRSA